MEFAEPVQGFQILLPISLRTLIMEGAGCQIDSAQTQLPVFQLFLGITLLHHIYLLPSSWTQAKTGPENCGPVSFLKHAFF